MIGLPQVVDVRVNAGPHVCGVYLDDEYVLHIIAAGEWLFRMNGRLYGVMPGDMVLLYPRLLHMVRPRGGEPLVQHVVHFRLPAMAHGAASGAADGMVRFGDYAAPLCVTLPKALRPGAGRLFRAAREEWLGDAPGRALSVGGIVAELLGLYVRCDGASRETGTIRSRAWVQLEESIALMHAEYADPRLSLDDLSRAAHLSRHHFCRLFRREIGMSPHQYLVRYRIERAQGLLMSGRLNCSQVAAATGFSSIHRFSRVFRQLVGRAPTVWQQSPV